MDDKIKMMLPPKDGAAQIPFKAPCYTFKSLEVREIVKSFLSVNGFDGLVDCYGECGCELDDLMCCDCSGIECLAAYKKKASHPVETDKSWRMVQAPDSDIEKVKDTHRAAWIEAVHSTDRIFKKIIRKGMDTLELEMFYK